MKQYKFLVLIIVASVIVSCYKDLGNYTYDPLTKISISNIPELIEVLGDVDKIVIQPKIVSSEEGEILVNNPNFEFKYLIENSTGGRVNSGTANSGSWLNFNPRGNRDLDTIANLVPNTYIIWFSVKDKRSNVETIVTTKLKVTSITYEGWFVLCEEGENARVRMDYIAKLGTNNYAPAYDVFASRNFPSTINKGYGVFFHPSLYANPGDRVLVMTGKGTFIPDANTFMFKTDIELSRLQYSNFLAGKYLDENPVYFYNTTAFGSGNNLFVSDKGNSFCLYGGLSGAIFQEPINTTKRASSPEYTFAPFIGLNEYSTQGGKSVSSAIFYDKGNKRFIGWSSLSEASAQITTPLQDPAPNEKLFSYRTGMDLVYMESTRFSGGVTFAVLQDNSGKRHIYGLNYPSTYTIGQHSMINNVDAPEFNSAKTFAFSSQYAFTYYAVGNKVYSFDRGTNTTKVVLTLPSTEVVTRLKFVLIQNDLRYSPNITQTYLDAQYNLVVGSFDSALGKNGGYVRMMKVNNADNSLSQLNLYKGFSKIVDFAYRERR